MCKAAPRKGCKPSPAVKVLVHQERGDPFLLNWQDCTIQYLAQPVPQSRSQGDSHPSGPFGGGGRWSSCTCRKLFLRILFLVIIFLAKERKREELLAKRRGAKPESAPTKNLWANFAERTAHATEAFGAQSRGEKALGILCTGILGGERILMPVLTLQLVPRGWLLIEGIGQGWVPLAATNLSGNIPGAHS